MIEIDPHPIGGELNNLIGVVLVVVAMDRAILEAQVHRLVGLIDLNPAGAGEDRGGEDSRALVGNKDVVHLAVFVIDLGSVQDQAGKIIIEGHGQDADGGNAAGDGKGLAAKGGIGSRFDI